MLEVIDKPRCLDAHMYVWAPWKALRWLVQFSRLEPVPMNEAALRKASTMSNMITCSLLTQKPEEDYHLE